MSWLPLPYIQLESARTNGADYLDTQWSAGYGFSIQFAGCAFTDGAYLFGAMTSEDSADKFALQFQDGKYIYYFGDKTAESPAEYELGEPHYFSLSNSGTWSIDGSSMPSVSFSLSTSNEMTLSVYVGAVNVGGEAQNLSDVQIGYLYFVGSSGLKEWRQCKTQDGQFGFYLYNGAAPTFVEKPDFTYGEVMAVQSGALSLVGAPTKKDYKIGEPFDATGATVYLNLDDGTQRDVTDEVSPNSRSYTYFNSNKIYRSGYVSYLYYRYNPVGVEYSNFNFGGGKEYSASLPQTLYYTVSSDSPVESIEVTKLPDKTDYLIKEYFSTTGMVVTGHLENGDTAEIGDGTSYSGVSYPLSTAGTFDVTVNWYDGSKYLYADPFQITVKNGLEKLNITLPTKSEYSIGEKFNPTGITVTALYLDGTERPIYNFFVDSSKFDSTKQGGYAITVKATVDEKEYTETITVYVFGEPKKLEDLLGTTEGMTVIRNNVKNDDNKDTVPGVDWFVFDGNTASNIYVSGNNFVSFDNTTEHIKICRRDGAIYYVYSQVGKLDNGHKFLKIRVEGYTHYGLTASEYALKYELFLFDDNSMYLNILQAPTNTYYLGTSELLYGTTHVAFTVEAGKAQVFSSYTTDAAQGKPWTVKAEYHEFLKSVMVDYITARPTKREYNLGDSFDATAFTVTAVHLDGSTETISDFTATSETFDGQKEGRYPVAVTANVNGQEYTAETLVAVYGEPYDILDLLNKKDGMEEKAGSGYSSDVNYFGDVRWFYFAGKEIEKIGLQSRGHIYFNEKQSFDICNNGYASNRACVQEGILENGHKFFKLKVEPVFENSFADYELFLFDDNSMYLNIISPPKSESSSLETKLIWGDGEIEIPVVFGEPQKFSFYTDNPAEGKPWTMEADYHNFIKEKMRTLTVKGGEGSGLYLPGEKVTVRAEEKSGNHFRWVKDGEIFAPKLKVISANSGFNLSGFKNGSLVVFAHTADVTSINGWTYDGTLMETGDKDAGATESIGHISVFHKINDGNISTNSTGYYFEIENAKSLELQESTRQENLLLTSANSFLCEKETDDLYLWFLYALYWSTTRRWVAQPDVVSYFPSVESSDSKAFSVLIDENVPPVSFRASVSSAMATRYGSAIGARIVPSCTGYEYEMTFTMPDEDLTVTAEYAPNLERIEITTKPFKLTYGLNGALNTSGMVVTAFYEDGTRRSVTEYTVSDLDSSTVGIKELTVTYTDGIDTATATLSVIVGLSGIAVTKYPNKRAYKQGERFDGDGLEISFVFADNSTYPTEEYRLRGFSSEKVGIKNIVVECGAYGNVIGVSYFTTQFSVTVTRDGGNPFSGYNAERTLRIHSLEGKFDDITGDEIESESMSLTESIGNDKNLQFGGCVSTQFTVNIFSEQFLDPDTFPEGDVEAYLETPDDSLKIFTGTLESAERTGGINKRKIIAYDYLKRKGTIKLKGWYNSLTFPMTQKQFRNSLFEYAGIKQVEMSLEYDDARVPDNMNVDSLTFLSLVKDICLCNMCFGHINADGEFEYIQIKPNGYYDSYTRGISYYTPDDAIPDEDVISATFKEGRIWEPASYWIIPNPSLPNIELPEPEGDASYRANIYFIRNSYMMGDSDWISKAYERVLYIREPNSYWKNELKYPIVMGPHTDGNGMSLRYLAREYTLTTPGDFLRRIGSNIEFNSIKYKEDGTPITWTINSYIMSRTITGVRSLKDVYTAKNSAYNEEAYGASKQIRDNTDALNSVKENMPKSTEESDGKNVSTDSFGGADYKSDIEWKKLHDEEMRRLDKEYHDKLTEEQKRKLADQEAAKKANEKKNTLTVYKDGTARYNGVTISGSDSGGGGGGGGGTGGGFNVVSVTSLPANPDLNNTIYLIQGEVVVN